MSKTIVGGMIIKMPLTEIYNYLRTILDISSFKSDDQLLMQLEGVLNRIRSKSGKHSTQKPIDVSNIMQLPLFDNLDADSKVRMQDQFEDVSYRMHSKVKHDPKSNK